MGLQGKLKIYSYSEHESEKQDVKITYPEDLPESDLNYDKRGTSEVLEKPKIIQNIEEKDEMYIKILSMQLINLSGQQTSVKVWSVNLRGYESKAKSDEDGGDYIWDDHFHLPNGKLENVMENEVNAYKEAYALLKEREGYENLIDA